MGVCLQSHEKGAAQGDRICPGEERDPSSTALDLDPPGPGRAGPGATLHQVQDAGCEFTPTATARLRNIPHCPVEQTTPVHITVERYPRVELTLACCCKHTPSSCCASISSAAL